MGNAIKNETTLKSLKTRLEKEYASARVLEMEIKSLNKKKDIIYKNIRSLKDSIDKIGKEYLVISEHAILRYIERVEIIPIEEVKAKVLSEQLIKMWKILGNGEYPIGDTGACAIIKNGIITTIKRE